MSGGSYNYMYSRIESEFEKKKDELLKEFDYLNDEREENNG